MTSHLPKDVEALVRRAASHPDGAEALFEANLESAACLYGVHATQLEFARDVLDAPAARVAANTLIADTPRRSPPPRRGHTAPADVATLIAEAASFPDGIALLTEAPMEMAAVRLGAHPFLVEEARTWLASRRRSNPFPAVPPPYCLPVNETLTGDRAS